MWADIFDIILNIYNTYKERKDNNSQRISKIFKDISEIIDSCIELLENDTYPHHYCEIMSAITKDLVKELSDILEVNKLLELESLLITASKLELEYANRKDKKTINALIVASARFKSMSILYQ
jgi:hypothetical protein